MSREVEDLNRHLTRFRDAMDRAYAEPLDARRGRAVLRRRHNGPQGGNVQ